MDRPAILSYTAAPSSCACQERLCQGLVSWGGNIHPATCQGSASMPRCGLIICSCYAAFGFCPWRRMLHIANPWFDLTGRPFTDRNTFTAQVVPCSFGRGEGTRLPDARSKKACSSTTGIDFPPTRSLPRTRYRRLLFCQTTHTVDNGRPPSALCASSMRLSAYKISRPQMPTIR